MSLSLSRSKNFNPSIYCMSNQYSTGIGLDGIFTFTWISQLLSDIYILFNKVAASIRKKRLQI